MKIYFTKEEFNNCKDFANKVKRKHQHFKDKDNTATRTLDQVAGDVIRGKLAEVALRKYLIKKHNGKCTVSDVDFEIYDDFVGDSFDLMYNDYIISIKSSKEFSYCLLIEKERFTKDRSGEIIGVDGKVDNLPDFYVFIRVKVDYDNYENCYAEICGAIPHKGFVKYKKEAPRNMILNKKNAEDFFILNKPPVFTGKGVPLLATNYGIHKDRLISF